MNLANALQYLPSKHREENLQEAVELLEEVLAVRSSRSDPMGYARVLANQANALAHLAVFDHAVTKYAEARDLFERVGDRDSVAVVDRQLEAIQQHRATHEGNPA
jgi:tetratricopeptide (TPR) repeat protein